MKHRQRQTPTGHSELSTVTSVNRAAISATTLAGYSSRLRHNKNIPVLSVAVWAQENVGKVVFNHFHRCSQVCSANENTIWNPSHSKGALSSPKPITGYNKDTFGKNYFLSETYIDIDIQQFEGECKEKEGQSERKNNIPEKWCLQCLVSSKLC